MKNFCMILGSLFVTGCSSSSQSLQLGGVTGALVGAAAIAAGSAAASGNERIKGKSIVIGAEVGSLLGLGMAFAIHRAVESDRRLTQENETELHFGDLPPNPFDVTNRKSALGGR